MANFKLFFEINGIGEDENGNPCAAAMSIDLGAQITDVDYWTVANSVDLSKLAAFFQLGYVTAQDIRVLSPEEYEQKYGEEDEEE